jgi:hypothetical protein
MLIFQVLPFLENTLKIVSAGFHLLYFTPISFLICGLSPRAFISYSFRHTPFKKGGAGAGMAPAPAILRRVSKCPEENAFNSLLYVYGFLFHVRDAYAHAHRMCLCPHVRGDARARVHAHAYEQAPGFLFSPPEHAHAGAYENAHECANACVHLFHT